MRTLLYLFALALALPLHFAKAETSPNIVVFLTDVLGWGDLACYGHPVIKTPHLDQFATEGVLFTQAYSDQDDSNVRQHHGNITQLDHAKAILNIYDISVEHPLPNTLQSVNHIGIYTKGTQTEFTMSVQTQ